MSHDLRDDFSLFLLLGAGAAVWLCVTYKVPKCKTKLRVNASKLRTVRTLRTVHFVELPAKIILKYVNKVPNMYQTQ